jgi:hypothetical protein
MCFGFGYVTRSRGFISCFAGASTETGSAFAFHLFLMVLPMALPTPTELPVLFLVRLWPSSCPQISWRPILSCSEKLALDLGDAKAVE